jgi:hypothetical protein
MELTPFLGINRMETFQVKFTANYTKADAAIMDKKYIQNY